MQSVIARAWRFAPCQLCDDYYYYANVAEQQKLSSAELQFVSKSAATFRIVSSGAPFSPAALFQ